MKLKMIGEEPLSPEVYQKGLMNAWKLKKSLESDPDIDSELIQYIGAYPTGSVSIRVEKGSYFSIYKSDLVGNLVISKITRVSTGTMEIRCQEEVKTE